jgi:hypothetical protein
MILESEGKLVIEPATVSFPSNISELNLDQWNLLAELIEQEYSNTLPGDETLKDYSKDIKSEPETLSSSFGSLSSEEIKSHYSSSECKILDIINMQNINKMLEMAK